MAKQERSYIPMNFTEDLVAALQQVTSDGRVLFWACDRVPGVYEDEKVREALRRASKTLKAQIPVIAPAILPRNRNRSNALLELEREGVLELSPRPVRGASPHTSLIVPGNDFRKVIYLAEQSHDIFSQKTTAEKRNKGYYSEEQWLSMARDEELYFLSWFDRAKSQRNGILLADMEPVRSLSGKLTDSRGGSGIDYATAIEASSQLSEETFTVLPR